jgi:hypothetical protein
MPVSSSFCKVLDATCLELHALFQAAPRSRRVPVTVTGHNWLPHQTAKAVRVALER